MKFDIQAGESGGARVCVLAGGGSTRMGRDKASLLLGDRTMLDAIRETAVATGLPVAEVREDSVSRCGPLGGVLTAFGRFDEARLLFLSCDMPFVTVELLRRLLAEPGPAFAAWNGRVGFPFTMDRDDLETLWICHAEGRLALREIARVLRAATVSSENPERELFNINTPSDLEAARRLA